MTYRDAALELFCSHCEERAHERAGCCGKPLCAEHALGDASCFECARVMADHEERRPLYVIGGCVSALGIVYGAAQLVTMPALLWLGGGIVIVSGPLSIWIHQRARRSLMDKRARRHGWERPRSAALPNPSVAELPPHKRHWTQRLLPPGRR